MAGLLRYPMRRVGLALVRLTGNLGVIRKKCLPAQGGSYDLESLTRMGCGASPSVSLRPFGSPFWIKLKMGHNGINVGGLIKK